MVEKKIEVYEEADCRDCGEGGSSRAHGISDGHHDHELYGAGATLEVRGEKGYG